VYSKSRHFRFFKKDFNVKNNKGNQVVNNRCIDVNGFGIKSSNNMDNCDYTKNVCNIECNNSALLLEHNDMMPCKNVFSEVCGSAGAQLDSPVCQAEQQGGGGPQQDSVSDQVYAHNIGSDNGCRFIINDHDVKGVASGVTTGSIDYSANREVLITDVLIMPGEGQSSGDGAQVQLQYDGVTSLGNWGHPDGATVYRQPHNDECDIQNCIGACHIDYGGKYFSSVNPDQDTLGDWDDPGGENELGEMLQRLDTTNSSPGPLFGVIPLNEQEIFQGPANMSIKPQDLWGKRVKGDNTIHNFNSYRVPVPSGFNVDLFQEMAEGYWDGQMFELLKYGFPLDVNDKFEPFTNTVNHASATKFPDHVQRYIDDELNHGALRKADTKTFAFFHKSPLMSRPKDENNRVILDLSWPKNPGASVNACVLDNRYLNTEFTLKLPTVDSICRIINAYEVPVMLFKIDLARAFRQIPIDPLDVAYLGINWGGGGRSTSTPPFRSASATVPPYARESLMRCVLKKCGITVVNYIDDFIAVVPAAQAFELFEITRSILLKIGLVLSDSKTVKPSYQCNCLGIIINTIEFTLCIPGDKLKSIIGICRQFQKFNKLRRQQIQSILGLLIYLHKAIKPARLFVNRVIALLRIAPHNGFVHVGYEFKRDLEWFCRFAQTYNGITRFDKNTVFIDYEVYTDASLSGIGARVNNKVYAYQINGRGENIAYWEALNVLVALRTWAEVFRHRMVRIWCDNAAAVSILQTSRGSDRVLQAIARNIWLLSAIWDINLVCEHIPRDKNDIADLLSRWRSHRAPVARLYELLNDQPEW
jgi:hypothetical protein